MAMALPVIATNWSGTTEFLDESVGYPLAIDGLEDVTLHKVQSNSFRLWSGHLWAKPSKTHLRTLMRRIVDRPNEAHERAAKARERMVERYSLKAVAGQVLAHLQRVARGV